MRTVNCIQNGMRKMSISGRTSHLPIYVISVCLLLHGLDSFGDIEITLDNSFINEYKDRACISAGFIVDQVPYAPHSAKEDADIHIAGRADEFRLAAVAEIMNARSVKPAVKFVQAAEGTGERIPMKGAWRIWCEHAGDDTFEQGAGLSPFTITNPPHIFEIHPVTEVGTLKVLDTLKPIPGYDPKDASDAFFRYEAVESKIFPGASKTKILTRGVGYNYVDRKSVV